MSRQPAEISRLIQELFDIGAGREVIYATIYSQCFHTLYFTEAGGRRKARENIDDSAGFFNRFCSEETFC